MTQNIEKLLNLAGDFPMKFARSFYSANGGELKSFEGEKYEVELPVDDEDDEDDED